MMWVSCKHNSLFWIKAIRYFAWMFIPFLFNPVQISGNSVLPSPALGLCPIWICDEPYSISFLGRVCRIEMLPPTKFTFMITIKSQWLTKIFVDSLWIVLFLYRFLLWFICSTSDDFYTDIGCVINLFNNRFFSFLFRFNFSLFLGFCLLFFSFFISRLGFGFCLCSFFCFLFRFSFFCFICLFLLCLSFRLFFLFDLSNCFFGFCNRLFRDFGFNCCICVFLNRNCSNRLFFFYFRQFCFGLNLVNFYSFFKFSLLFCNRFILRCVCFFLRDCTLGNCRPWYSVSV